MISLRGRTLQPLLLLLAGPTRLAPQPPAVQDQLRRIFASGDFAARQRFGPAEWVEGGTAYLTVEPSSAAPGRDIVRYDAATAARSVLVSAHELLRAGAAAPLDIEDYSWSADGGGLLVFTNSRRVWRQNTRGDYWVLDRRTATLRRLGGPAAPPASLMYAKSSPPGAPAGYAPSP